MNIEKLPSGSYRATVMIKGKRYKKTFDHIPTEKEFMISIADKISDMETLEKIGITFETAAKRYCDSKEKTLSAKTIREYILLYKRLPEWFLKKCIDDVTQIDINMLINELSNKSPKTIKNIHGFVSSVLRTFRPSMVIYTTLPKKSKEEPFIPSTEQVKQIMECFKGTEYEIPFVLAIYGMRKSEIIALEVSDIEGNLVHINKAKVLNSDNKWVVKKTKTSESTRDIYIPQYIADKIREQGYVYKGFPDNISRNMKRIEDKLGIPHFSLHKCRHYFASQMSSMGIPEADIMALGGWKTDGVMKTVYRHSMIEKEKNAKQVAAEKLAKQLF